MLRTIIPRLRLSLCVQSPVTCFARYTLITYFNDVTRLRLLSHFLL
jgi:hypothetical protein